MLDKTTKRIRDSAKPQRPWALASRRVVTPSGTRAAAVLIAGETIVDVTEPSDVPGSYPRRRRGRSGGLARPRRYSRAHQ